MAVEVVILVVPTVKVTETLMAVLLVVVLLEEVVTLVTSAFSEPITDHGH